MNWSLRLDQWKPDYLHLKQAISFSVQAGELWRIQGENAVGKTSLLKAIVKEASSKNLRVFFLTQFKDELFQFPLELREILKIYDLSKTHPLLQGLDLDRQWRRASGGERSRILLAIAFQQDVDLLILDEPEQALDESSREIFRQCLEAWRENRNRALIYVSHLSKNFLSDENQLLLERAS
ncbi:MAG: ATP-binding cassette domain-containing protein [Bdellovibrionota bacterium]